MLLADGELQVRSLYPGLVLDELVTVRADGGVSFDESQAAGSGADGESFVPPGSAVRAADTFRPR